MNDHKAVAKTDTAAHKTDDAEPRFGLTTKEMILRLVDGDDETTDPIEVQATNQPSNDILAYIKQAPDYLQAVPLKERPTIPFVARPRMPRSTREKVLAKLFGEHLALQAFNAGHLTPAVAVAVEELKQRAANGALEQERVLFDSCTSTQVYANKASRLSALDAPVHKKDHDAQGIYEDLLADEAKRKKEEEERLQQKKRNNNKRRKFVSIPRDDLQQPELSKEQAPTTSKPGLVEDDLDWNASPEEGLSSFIRQHLEESGKPLTAQQQTIILEKCTSKVIQGHKGTLPDDLLEREGSKIRKLIDGYIEHTAQHH